jgi:hypothetical protein
MVLTLNLLPFILNYSLLDLMIFGIPHTFLYTLSLHYNCSIIFWPLVYFYLICRYIKIKIEEQNDLIAKAIVERKVIITQKMLRSNRNLNAIYSEINENNHDFWSFIWSSYNFYDLFLIFLRIDFNFKTDCWLWFIFLKSDLFIHNKYRVFSSLRGE